jgi:ABC-type iron transport system FetAB ATPase subunit
MQLGVTRDIAPSPSLPNFSEASVVQLLNICVRVPFSSNTLVRGLNLTIPSNILLMGPSGCGKSSVLRVIAGLWPAEGHVKAPAVGHDGMCFLTQRPYMCPGSLRQNVAYPSQDYISDSDLKRLLGMAGLSALFDRTIDFDEVLDWVNILSLGEQQRLAFARCFHMMPRVAVLDESTSALDPDNEELVYQTLRTLNISFVSVGHRSQLRAFHDQLVLFDGQGNYSASRIEAAPISLPDSRVASQIPSPRVTSLPPSQRRVQAPPTTFRYLFRILFWRADSSKNFLVHCLLVLIIVFSFCQILYSKDIIFARGIYYFENTSVNDILKFFLIILLLTALEATIVNSLIAYVALRSLKNLCREMHKQYFANNT